MKKRFIEDGWYARDMDNCITGIFCVKKTIQSPFAKSPLQGFPFAHVVTSPYKFDILYPCKHEQMSNLHGSE